MRERNNVRNQDRTYGIRFDDQQVNLGAVGFGSSAPTIRAFKGSEVLGFANGQSNSISFISQLTHRYKVNSLIEFHVHNIAPDNNAGNVVWQLTYSIADVNGVFPAESTITKTVIIPINSLDKHLVLDIGDLGLTSSNVSALILCSLTRLGSDELDTYGNEIYLSALDFHIEVDNIGSKTELSKN